MQKYDFHFLLQISKWIFRGFAKPFVKTELTLSEAIQTGKTVKFAYVKESTGELREAIGNKLHYGKNGNILYYDIEKEAIRSLKPENLQSQKLKVA